MPHQLLYILSDTSFKRAYMIISPTKDYHLSCRRWLFIFMIALTAVNLILTFHSLLTVREHELQCALCELKLERIQQMEDLERDWRTGCPKPGQGPKGVVVTVVPGGRFGNYVWEYLSVWSVARRMGVWPAVPRDILDSMRRVFPALTIPALEDVAKRCNLPHLLTRFKQYEEHGNKEALHSEIEAQWKGATSVSLVIWPKYSLDRDSFLPFWREMRAQTKFSTNLQEQAQQALRRAMEEVRQRADPTWTADETPEFVAVHVRRTDYIEYIKRKFPGSIPADESFFLKAMENMRAQFTGRRIVMVVVSDDLTWCRKKLHGPDVSFPGTGDIDSPWLDLVILSACNHTVFAYGTFALTAAMQHPDGLAYVYDPQPKDGELHPVQAIAAHLPGWKVIKMEQNITSTVS